MQAQLSRVMRAVFATRLEDDDGAELARMLAHDWGPEKTAAVVAELEAARDDLQRLARGCRIAIRHLRNASR